MTGSYSFGNLTAYTTPADMANGIAFLPKEYAPQLADEVVRAINSNKFIAIGPIRVEVWTAIGADKRPTAAATFVTYAPFDGVCPVSVSGLDYDDGVVIGATLNAIWGTKSVEAQVHIGNVELIVSE